MVSWLTASLAPMRLATFHVSSAECALPLDRLREIVEPPPITRVPGAPVALRGVVNLRGGVIPVLDLAARLGLPPSAAERPCLLIAEAAAAGGPCALAVDGIRGIEEVPEDRVMPPRADVLGAGDWLAGFVDTGERLLLLIDVERLLDPDTIRAIRLLPGRAEAPRARAVPSPVGEAYPHAMAMPSSPTSSSTAVRTPAPAPDSAPAPVSASNRISTRTRVSTPVSTPSPVSTSAPVSARATAPSTPSTPTRSPPRPPSFPVPAPALPPRAPMAAWRAEAPVFPSHAPPRAERTSSLPVAATAEGAAAPAPDRRRAAGIAAVVIVVALALAAIRAVTGGSDVRPVPSGAPERAVGEARAGASQVAIAEPVAPPAPAVAASAPTVAEQPPAQPPPPAAAARPAPLRPGEQYEVVGGDTLWSISRRMLGDPYAWPDIHAANRAAVRNPDLILPGQRLVVPPRSPDARSATR